MAALLLYAVAMLAALPGTAAASSSTAGPSYGHFTDLCAKSASPSSQTVNNTTGSATATVNNTLTKKEDYVYEWDWWRWQYVAVKTWGCVTGGSAPAASNVAASGVTVSWQVISGPNTGKSGSGTTNSSGVYALSYTNTAMADGTDTVRVTATRRWCERQDTTLSTCQSSYPSSMRSATLTDDVTITWTGTPAPDTSFTSKPPAVTTDTTPTFQIASTVAGSTFQCSVDGGAWATTSASFTPTLANGQHTVSCRAIAPNGATDASPASYTFTIETTPPNTTITGAPTGPTNDTTPTVNVSATGTGPTIRCRADSGAWQTGVEATGKYTTPVLTNGAHTVTCEATGANGLTDPTPATATVTIDTVAPNTSIAGLADVTGSTSVTFTAASTEAGSTIQCRLDSQAWFAYTGAKTLTGLSSGSHTVQCVSTDPAGNIDATPASKTFVVDLTIPETTIVADQGSPTKTNPPSFSVSASIAGSTISCRVDGGVWQTGVEATGKYAPSGLADGSHTVECEAKGANGNTDPTPATATVTIDTTAPDTSIAGLPTYTSERTVAFTAATNDPSALIKCRYDDSEWFVFDQQITLTGLADGWHEVICYAADALGNADDTPAYHGFEVGPPPAVPGGGEVTPTTPLPVDPPKKDKKKKKKKSKKKTKPHLVIVMNTKKCHKASLPVSVKGVKARIRSVTGWIDGKFLGTDDSPPFREKLLLDAFGNGGHTLKIKATLSNGKRLTAKKRFRICR